MKFSLSRSDLLKPLQLVTGVVERSQTMAILSNVLIHVAPDMLTLTGTDIEIQMTVTIPLEPGTTEAGDITLSGRKFVDIVKALPQDAQINLYLDKNKVIIRSGRSRFSLSTLPATEFPTFELEEDLRLYPVDQQDLHALISNTYFAMAEQDVRFYLNGMFMELRDNSIKTVATDGHRLALSTQTTTESYEEHASALIPRKAILEMMRLLGEDSETLELGVANHYFQLKGPRFVFRSKLLEGNYPNYNQVIPKNGDKFAVANRLELKQALSRAAILCNEQFRGIRLQFRDNLIKIFANHADQGQAEEEIAVNYQSDDLELGLNVSYLIDVLNAINTEEVTMTLKDNDSSLLIENDNATYVVMPMRL